MTTLAKPLQAVNNTRGMMRRISMAAVENTILVFIVLIITVSKINSSSTPIFPLMTILAKTNTRRCMTS